MKRLLSAVALIGFADTAAAQDWSGAYVGAQSANSSYTNRYFVDGVFDFSPVDGGGAMHGLFAGYNHQIGNFVVGGEIAYLNGEPTYDGAPEFFYTDMLDLKARAGYSVGRVLPYAVIGWSKTEWTNPGLVPVDVDGMSYGLGVDIRVSDRVLVGLEYLKRDLVGINWVEFPSINIEGDVSTVAFRVAYSF